MMYNGICLLIYVTTPLRSTLAQLQPDGEFSRRLLRECGNNICDMNESASTCTLDCSDLSLDGAEKNRWGANGMIFMTKALRDISVNWMQYHSWQGNVNQTVQVFTRSGDYIGYDTNGDGWNLIHDNMIVSNSPQYKTFVEFDTPVIIEANATQSFYIHADNYLLFDDGTREGALFSNNSELKLYEGRAKLDLFGDFFKEPSVFQGRMGYDIIQVTAEPSASPSLITTYTPSQSSSPSAIMAPSTFPSSMPSMIPSSEPSHAPSQLPSLSPSISPSVSSQPSSGPSISSKPSAAPSVTPTIYCDSSKSRISVEVKTDRYSADDNSWKLFDDAGNVIASREIGTFENNAVHEDEVCIPRCINVTFTFYDEFGDGLLDSDDGYFLILFYDGFTDPIKGGHNGDVGPANFKERTVLIETYPTTTCAPSPQPSIYSSHTQLPSLPSKLSTMPSGESSNQPSMPPTSPSPTPYQSTISSLFQQPSSKPFLFSKLSAAPSILCDPSKSRISVQVKTDEHGMNDNSWTFFDDADHVISSREVGTFDNEAIRDDEVCVPRCTNVTFKFYDLSGDGLEGYFLLTFHDRTTDPIIGDYGSEKYNEKTLLIEKDPWASCVPSSYPSLRPSHTHSPALTSKYDQLSSQPSNDSERQTSSAPTNSPKLNKSDAPFDVPTSNPTLISRFVPSGIPSVRPSRILTIKPSGQPSFRPKGSSSRYLTLAPTDVPSRGTITKVSNPDTLSPSLPNKDTSSKSNVSISYAPSLIEHSFIPTSKETEYLLSSGRKNYVSYGRCSCSIFSSILAIFFFL